MDFNLSIGVFSKTFGKENIQVLLVEELARDVDKFAEEISSFMGIDYEEVRKSLTGSHENRVSSKRFRNFRRWYRVLTPGIPQVQNVIPKRLLIGIKRRLIVGRSEKTSLDKDLDERIINFYSGGNRSLDKQYNLNLSKYDYF